MGERRAYKPLHHLKEIPTWLFLHKYGFRLCSPYARRILAVASVLGMPSAVKPLRITVWICAICRPKSRAERR